MEDSFSAENKAGALFVDITAAYNTVWHNLLQSLPDGHMVHMIMEMVSNSSFTLATGNRKRNRLRRLKNRVPQGSVLAPLFFNTYISDLPTTVSRKYSCADDLANMHADGNWQAVEGVLSKEMAKKNRLQRLKNGIPQGSVLAPLLFNTYISDLPTTVSRKYIYAGDHAC